MNQTLHLHEFFVEGSSPEISHALLNITEPSTPEEKSKGYFFAICEISNADRRYIAKIQSIVDEIENTYYEVPDEEQRSALEIVLEEVNQESFSIVKPDIDFHCIVGAIRQNDIIFSFYGQPQMLLFYKDKEGNYKKMDLVASNQAEEHNQERRQLFSQIIQGKIGQGDYLFAGTPHIVDYFNHDRLQKIVTTRPSRQSAEHLQRVLAELKNDLSFGGIIINLEKGNQGDSAPRIPPMKRGDSARSLKSLFSTEQKTATILAPSFLPRLHSKLQNALHNTETAQPQESPRETLSLFPNTQINASHLKARQAHRAVQTKTDWVATVKRSLELVWKLVRYVARGLLWLLLIGGSALSALGRFILNLFFVAANYQNRRQTVLAHWARRRHTMKENIRNLPLFTKLLLGSSCAIALIFTGSIIYLKAHQRQADQAQAYEQAVQHIRDKNNSAESAFVYNNFNLALADLQESETLLRALSCKSDNERRTCQTLREELTALFFKVRRLKTVHPTLLTDFNSAAPLEKIISINNKMISFSTQTSTVIMYDPLVKENKVITPPFAVSGFTAAAVPKENDYAIFIYESNKALQFNPHDNSWKRIDLDFPEEAAVSAVVVYNRRLYTLDTKNSRIYRHDAIQTGFGRGKEWLKEAADLQHGIDITIDGDVFTLEQSGTVYKFTTGQKQAFDSKGLDPALATADEIWTYTDLTYLYILDSTNKRLIVMDKHGQLKHQLTAVEFMKPTGMVVDEPKGVAYILDGNRLYQISLR